MTASFKSLFSRAERVIYFIRPVGMTGPVKIGCSLSPDGRLETLATWAPFPLEVAATLPGSMVVERQFHAMFRASHFHREWFHWTPDLQAVIDQINAACFDLSLLPNPKGLEPSVKRKPWTDEQKAECRRRNAERRELQAVYQSSRMIPAGTPPPSR